MAGRIIRSSESLNAMPFYRSLWRYRGLMQLEKSAKGKDSLKSLVDDGHDLERLMRLKKDAAAVSYNCLRDGQVESLGKAKSWSDRRHLAPFSRILSKLIEAYADVRATKLGKETPLPAPEKSSKTSKDNAYRGEMCIQAKLESIFTSAPANAGKPDGYK